MKLTLEDICSDESNKVNKCTAAKIRSIFYQIEEQYMNLQLRISYLNGRLAERDEMTKKIDKKLEKIDKIPTGTTYAGKLKSTIPKLGKNKIISKSSEKNGNNISNKH